MSDPRSVKANPFDGYRFDLRCPSCGRRLDHVASGIEGLATTQAVAACRPCRTSWRVEVTLHNTRTEAKTEAAIRNL